MSKAIDRTLGGKMSGIIETAVEAFRDSMTYRSLPELCESEIEGMLAAAVYACEAVPFEFGVVHRYETIWPIDEPWRIEGLKIHGFHENVVTAIPQVIVGSLRLDFLFVMRMAAIANKKERAQYLAVECDGHEFHEKTKQQATRDKARDRELLIRGIPSMRFTGSEVWKDPYACVVQIDGFFRSAHRDFLREAHAGDNLWGDNVGK